ncbi:MAG: RluA family pseudouridine synthase [Planctomycetes bacterium]|nr:RluA family pseudouridine synthase [Planctomycetota bacterium]
MGGHDQLRVRLDASATGRVLLDWLPERFRYLDRDGWAAQLRDGRVRLGGAVADGGEVLHGGDELVFVPAAAADRVEPVPVLFVDDALVVVDKPAHTVVQRASAFPGRTFVATLSRGFPPRDLEMLEPAHRLDRETSGVLVLARSRAAFAALQRAFAGGDVQKRYVAVARGVFGPDEVVVRSAIGPAAGSVVRARRAVVAHGASGARAAETAFAVLERLANATVVAATPRTGRTHQLRVHLEHLGHPLVGDVLYGHDDARYLEFVEAQKRGGPARRPGDDAVARQLLHAESLAFAHPLTGEPLHMTAPWPAELREYVARHRGG